MACLDMYNSEHKSHHHHCPPMSSRISFSNDFVETQQIMKQEKNSREAPPVSSDFEFSVSNYSMMSADELLFKGKLLPFKDDCSNQMQRTLREELLAGDDDDDDDNVTLTPPKGATRWKGFLGLKKVDKNEGYMEKMGDSKRSAFVHEELLTEGGPNCRNVEIGI
ncbi:B3 domain-containing protein [Hibiscus syriacus]|uniref:B3 domain-containing protein n=1 Tax=Hibiscus syriacus TaxID=106335 RepID=A0A6A2ZUY1_HIBSY|nr:uncharacterized protein LOC120139349 [Hibiscus syriacus]KAE8695089.1 B3 domain-containing protein [Hibiscus syriacus]